MISSRSPVSLALGLYWNFDHDGVIATVNGNDHLCDLNQNCYGSHIGSPFRAAWSPFQAALVFREKVIPALTTRQMLPLNHKLSAG